MNEVIERKELLGKFLIFILLMALILIEAKFLLFPSTSSVNKTGYTYENTESSHGQLKLIKNYCSDGEIVFKIENSGPYINSKEIRCISLVNPCKEECSFSDFSRGTNTIIVKGCGKGVHKFKLETPRGTLFIGAECY